MAETQTSSIDQQTKALMDQVHKITDTRVVEIADILNKSQEIVKQQLNLQKTYAAELTGLVETCKKAGFLMSPKTLRIVTELQKTITSLPKLGSEKKPRKASNIERIDVQLGKNMIRVRVKPRPINRTQAHSLRQSMREIESIEGMIFHAKEHLISDMSNAEFNQAAAYLVQSKIIEAKHEKGKLWLRLLESGKNLDLPTDLRH